MWLSNRSLGQAIGPWSLEVMTNGVQGEAEKETDCVAGLTWCRECCFMLSRTRAFFAKLSFKETHVEAPYRSVSKV